MMEYGCYFLTLILITCIGFASSVGPSVYGISAVYTELSYIDGFLELPAGVEVPLRLFGEEISKFSKISFSKFNGTLNASCVDNRITKVFDLTTIDRNSTIGHAQVTLKKVDHRLYLCAKLRESDTWLHQGGDPWLGIVVVKKGPLMVLGLQILLIVVLFTLSGLFSGLNLGLMSLDPTELNIIERAGSETEKRYAKQIRPVRKRGNFLLCTLLLGNVLVNNTLAILMDNLTGSGMIAIVASTLGIVIFGEIIPQAICSRHGLAVGARTMIITKLFMILTFPISFPISVILDKVLGEEIGHVYSREKLGELIRDQGAKGFVQTDEVNIITGALSLTQKTVRDVMTPLEDAYMIPYEATLDFDTMNEIIRHGFTRIPVYSDNDKTQVCAVLNVKDLAFIDPDDKTPLKTVCQFYQRPVIVVDAETKLDNMLTDFRQGKAHMAFIDDLDNESEGDPTRIVIGLVTLEDVIEEIIQAEIIDETDIITDNVKKLRRHVRHQDFSIFNVPDIENRPRLSPQMKVAACQHMSSNIPVFDPSYVSVTVLQKLLNQDIVVNSTVKSDGPPFYVYEAGKPADYAVLILQGRGRVQMTKDNLVFVAGPFMFFGEDFLDAVNVEIKKCSNPGSLWKMIHRLPPFIPDYTLEAETDLEYLRISRGQYVAARLTSDMQAEHGEDRVGERFELEWDRQRSMLEESGTANNYNASNCSHSNRASRSASSTGLNALNSNEGPTAEPDVADANGDLAIVTLPDVRVDIGEEGTTASAYPENDPSLDANTNSQCNDTKAGKETTPFLTHNPNTTARV